MSWCVSSGKRVLDCSDIVVLNMIVPWVVGKTYERDSIEMEADPRHVSILVGTTRVDQLCRLEFDWWNHVVMSWTRIVERLKVSSNETGVPCSGKISPELILPTREEKWRNNSSQRDFFFFETFWANSSGGFEVLETFF